MQRSLQSLLLILLLAAPWSETAAQWRSDSTTNTTVIKATGIQANPKAVSDGNNGVIIVWEDTRYGAGYDIWAQHLDANGMKLWPDTGVKICVNTGDQRYPQIVTDGNGGAYIAWEDRRSASLSSDIYAQHINGSGAVSYAANGVAVATATRDQEAFSICADGNGGAYIAWEDNRSNTTVTRPDIWMNRLTTAGPQWSNGAGRAIITQSNQQRRPRLADDGQGGCILVFETTQGIPPSLWATRVNSSGTVLWGTSGATVFRGSGQTNVARNAHVVRDGNKFLIAWEVTSLSSSGQDIMANKLAMDSTKEWSSPAEVTGEWPGDQTNPRIIGDDSNGVIVVFEDYLGDQTNRDIGAVRVYPNGVDRLPSYSNGFAMLSRQLRGQTGPEIVKSDEGGFIAVWNDGRNADGDSSIYANRMNRQMRRQFPTANATSTWGLPINSSPQYVSKQVTIVPRTNGAIAVWSGNRDGTFDIFAQLIFKDGTLPIELASFTAKTNDLGHVLLDWKTANEFDNAGFEVERRTIGASSNEFEVIASYLSENSLRGAGTSSTAQHYSFVDQPAEGIYEYRIADVGLDGSRTSHSIRRVEVGYASGRAWSVGAVFPNPASTSQLRLPVTVAEPSILIVTVRNLLGQIAYKNEYSVSAGSQSLSLALPELPNGSYMYQVAAYSTEGVPIWVGRSGQLNLQR
jgi:hypothetical protein